MKSAPPAFAADTRLVALQDLVDGVSRLGSVPHLASTQLKASPNFSARSDFGTFFRSTTREAQLGLRL